MNITRFAKSIAYLAAAALLIAVSVFFQLGMHSEGGMETSYFRSNLFLFIAAAGCLGTGVYSYIGYVRRHREHAFDSLFLVIVGAVVMAAFLFVFLNFGGLGDTFEKDGYTATNVNIVMLTLLPLPFLIRGIVLALSTRDDSKARRRGVQIAALLVTAGMIASLAFGGMMRMVRFDESSSFSDEVSDDSDEGKWI